MKVKSEYKMIGLEKSVRCYKEYFDIRVSIEIPLWVGKKVYNIKNVIECNVNKYLFSPNVLPVW